MFTRTILCVAALSVLSAAVAFADGGFIAAAGSGTSTTQPAATRPDNQVQTKVVFGGAVAGQGQVIVQGGGAAQVQVIAGNGAGMSRSMSMGNAKGRFEYSENNGDKHLKVSDTDGKQLFDGPVNTDAERKKIPAEAREIVKVSRDMMGKFAAVRGGVAVAGGNGLQIQAVPQASDDPLGEILGLNSKAADEFFRRVGDYGVKVSVSAEGKRRLLVTGKDDAVVFDGPIDTADQWSAIKDVPKDVLDAARKMDKNLAVESAPKPPATAPSGQ